MSNIITYVVFVVGFWGVVFVRHEVPFGFAQDNRVVLIINLWLKNRKKNQRGQEVT